MERLGVTLERGIDRKAPLTCKLSRTGATRGNKNHLSFEPIAHALQIIKVGRTLKGPVLRRQHHGHLFASKLFLCDNGSQDIFSFISRRNMNDTDACGAWVIGTQDLCAISLLHTKYPFAL
jgi:hypothetical protein